MNAYGSYKPPQQIWEEQRENIQQAVLVYEEACNTLWGEQEGGYKLSGIFQLALGCFTDELGLEPVERTIVEAVKIMGPDDSKWFISATCLAAVTKKYAGFRSLPKNIKRMLSGSGS